jgi:hypothetical protein
MTDAGKTKLTKAQRAALEAASRGGVLGYGIHKATVLNLRKRKLLSRDRDASGYYTLTDAGRSALSEHRQ